jgi:hypothetical protein
VIFDEHKDFKSNAMNFAKSGGRALGSIISKIHGLKTVGFKTFEKLYSAGVSPVIDYCSGVWGGSKYHIKQFNIGQFDTSWGSTDLHQF